MWKWLKSRLQRSTAERATRAEFAKRHPTSAIVWSRSAAVEAERTVVGVYYDWGDKPPRFEFFVVDRTTNRATHLHDDEPDRPKSWR